MTGSPREELTFLIQTLYLKMGGMSTTNLDGFRNRKLSQVERNQKELLEKAADTFAKGMRSMQYQEGAQSESRYSTKLGGYFPDNEVSTKDVEEYGIKDINNKNEVIAKLRNVLSKSYLSTEKQRKPIVNMDTGMEIEIMMGGIRETFGKDEYYAALSDDEKLVKIASMSKLANLIKYGEVRAQEAANKHNPNSSVRYAYLTAPLRVDGQNYIVNMDIRKSPEGENRFYIHSLQVNNNATSSHSAGTSLKKGTHRLKNGDVALFNGNSMPQKRSKVNSQFNSSIFDRLPEEQRQKLLGNNGNMYSFSNTDTSGRELTVEQDDIRYSFSENSEALKAQQMESEEIDLSVGFDGYTEKEISNIESNRIKIARSKNDLSSFIEDAINNIGSPKVKMFIGKVGNELGNKIKQATQADVTGYNVSLSNHEAIKIMLNSHGNEQKEALRGQRAVKKDDLMMMADVVGNPDNIVYGGTNEHGKPVIRFEKSLGDLYVCVQTVSDKHHTLESKTMYIIKKSHSTGTDDIKSPVATFETNSGKALLNDHIILQNQEESNNKSDIRYSLNNPQQENIDKYGAIPPGENPYGNNRDIQVPQQTADDNKVGRFNRTAVESQQVNDQTVDALMRDLRTYTPSSNQKQLNHANNVINSVGWAEAAQSFQTRYKAGEKMTANDIAIGERCIQEAQKAGNYQKAAELIGDVAALGVELGQAVQAMSMLKRLTPEGRLMALKRVQQRINADLQQKNNKKKSNDITPKLQTAEQEQQTQQESNQVTISPETERRILEARGQQEMDDAWDAATQEMADQLDATLMDKVRAWRYLGMLSNIRTHIRNIVSNGVKRGVIGIEHQIEAGLETAFVKEGGERYRTFKKVPKEYKEFAEWDFETNIRRLMEQTGSRYNDAVGQINRNKRIFKPNALEKVRKTNENWLGGEDMWFKKDAYIDAFSNYLVANNLSPSVLQNNANATSTYEAAQNYAMEKAFEATFQEANKVATFLSQIEHSSKIEEVLIGALMPFKKTPLNILKQGTMVYSPVGLVKGLTNAMTKVKSGEMTQVGAIEQISRGLTGTGIAAVGALMMSLGMIALGGDDDKRKAKYDQQMGDQTYALKFRDGSTYSIDWLSPSVMPLLMGAEIYDSVKRAYNGELTDQSMMSAVTSSLMRIGDPLLEMSCMSGLADALSSYSDGGTEAMSNIIGTSIKNYAGQFIPAPVGALARTIDDTVRSSYASKDSAIGKGNEQFLRQQRSKIPGVSMQNEASIDVWGNERKREGSNIAGRAFNNFINPGNYSSNKRTALDNELEALYQSTGDSGIFPALASSTINESKQNPKISMTPEEYSRFSTIKGKKSQQYVSDFVNSEAYDQLDDSEKADIISSLYELANYEARKQTLDKRGYDYNLSDKEEVLESDVKPYEYYAAKKRFSGKWKTYKTVVKYAEHADRLGMDDDKYVEMNEALDDITADKKNGKTVSGSRQKKVKEYLNRELNAGNITKEQWWYWYAMEYPTQAKNSPYAWQRTLHDDTESTTAQQQTDKDKANRSIQAVTTLQRPKR